MNEPDFVVTGAGLGRPMGRPYKFCDVGARHACARD